MAANPLKTDPSRTVMIRRRWLADMKRRFERLEKDITTFVATDDKLGLAIKRVTFNTDFAFATDPDKLKIFNEWFQRQVTAGILTVDGTGKPWTAKYVESAYKKGKVRAYIETHPELNQSADFIKGSQAGFLESSFSAPEAVSKLRLLATRSFEDLKAVTAADSAAMNRILASGIAHGEHPKVMAREMRSEIGKLTRTRALAIARTETIHAQAEGQLDGLEDLGIKYVEADVEVMTAGDSRVCPICEALEGEVFTISEARGVIPLHPSCRCAWAPVNIRTVSADKRKRADDRASKRRG